MKKKRSSRRWTGEEIAFLLKHYPRYDTDWVASELCRTALAVALKASRLELSKAPQSERRSPTLNRIPPVRHGWGASGMGGRHHEPAG
jgi:hypothetical protein